MVLKFFINNLITYNNNGKYLNNIIIIVHFLIKLNKLYERVIKINSDIINIKSVLYNYFIVLKVIKDYNIIVIKLR